MRLIFRLILFGFFKPERNKMTNIIIKEFDNKAALEVGQRIQSLRLKNEITAVELSEYLEITSNQLSRIENGRTKSKLEYIYAVAQIFHCSTDYLLFGEIESEEKYQENGDTVEITKEQFEAIKTVIAAFKKI